MRILRDFECVKCGGITESLCEANISRITCADCGSDAVAMLSTPAIRLEGISGAFPDAHNKWAKIREDNAKIKAAKS